MLFLLIIRSTMKICISNKNLKLERILEKCIYNKIKEKAYISLYLIYMLFLLIKYFDSI
jgi:hypothetical protein